MVQQTRIQSKAKSYQRHKKMLLDAALLNTQHYNVRIKGNRSNLGKGVAPFPTPQCSSY